MAIHINPLNIVPVETSLSAASGAGAWLKLTWFILFDGS